MADILFAEDDAKIRAWVSYALEKDGHAVRAVADGGAALAAFAAQRPQLLILDVMMPVKSGYDVCTEIRKTDRALPILMLTAKGAENDKVLGLGLGADDYVTKPFGLRELRARVNALLRRTDAAAAEAVEPPDEARTAFAFGSHRVDEARRLLLAADGSSQDLSELEVGLLRFLAAHPDEVVARDALLNGLWGLSYTGTTRTLDTRVASLRKKLGSDAVCIETLYGTGYRYRPPGAGGSRQ